MSQKLFIVNEKKEVEIQKNGIYFFSTKVEEIDELIDLLNKVKTNESTEKN